MSLRTDLAPGQKATLLLSALCLTAGLALFWLLRIRWVGHLLTWDEAMNLCSVRSFVSQGNDYYSYWFWRHPPIHKLLLTLVRPLDAGFAERAQVLSIFFGAINVAVLFNFNRVLYGTKVAFYSLVFLAVMPRAMLYDVWVKSDVLVIFPCLLALQFFLRHRPLMAGLALGAAFLIKETAIFYAIAVFALWCFQPRPVREWRTIAAVALTAIGISIWWYALFSVSLKHFFALATGMHMAGVETATHPWYFYLVKLSTNIGIVGPLLALLGVISIRQRMTAEEKEGHALLGEAWPIALLVPAYVILHVLPAKSIHFDTVLEPAWATMQALGLEWTMAGFVAGLAKAKFQKRLALVTAQAAALVVVFGNLILHATSVDYERLLAQQEVGGWGAAASREAAQALNRVVKKDQRVLITPMYYWLDENKYPDPIFVYYLDKMPVLVRPLTIRADDLAWAVRRFQIDWAMISPFPEAARDALTFPMRVKYGLEPTALKGALIYRTSGLYTNGSASAAESMD